MRIFFTLIIAIVALAGDVAVREALGSAALQNLPVGKAALVYERVDQHGLQVSIIKKDRVKRVLLPAAERVVDRLVGQLLNDLTPDLAAGAALADLPEFDAETAHDLFKLLVQPLMSDLGGIDRLAIAADGQLAALPFDALLMTLPSAEQRDAKAYAAYSWLRTAFAISRLTKTAKRNESTDRTSRIEGGLIGFGNPAITQNAAFPLSALPEANLELAQLRMNLRGRPGKIAVGVQASEARLKAALASSGHLAVLALATHGSKVLDAKDDAVLMLTAGDGEDGLLTAEEVSALDFQADLVILSACDSGAEALVDAFIQAGGDQVLALRWAVLSDVARQISTTIVAMTQSDADLPHDLALWRAVDQLISGGTSSHFGHPMIWAPFVLTTAKA